MLESKIITNFQLKTDHLAKRGFNKISVHQRNQRKILPRIFWRNDMKDKIEEELSRLTSSRDSIGLPKLYCVSQIMTQLQMFGVSAVFWQSCSITPRIIRLRTKIINIDICLEALLVSLFHQLLKYPSRKLRLQMWWRKATS